MRKNRVKVRLKTKIEYSKKRKNLLRKITITTILVAVFGFVVNKGSKFLLTSPIFNVKSTDVVGAGITDKSAILRCLDDNGKNIFAIKLNKSELQLKKLFPVIKNIKINRQLPNKIIVKIEERTPLAEIASTTERIGIDENKKLFVLPENYAFLPKISGNLSDENKSACLTFLKNVLGLSIYKKINGITADAVDNIVFFISDDCKVCIGDFGNTEQKISYLTKVLTDLEIKGKKAQYINMRDFSDECKEVIVRMKAESREYGLVKPTAEIRK